MALIKREDIQKYILNNLGYPVVAVELAPEQIGEAISIAIDEYLTSGAHEISYAELKVENGTINKYELPKDVATVHNVQYAIPSNVAAGSTDDIFSFAVYSSPFGPNYTNYVHAAGNLAVFFEYLQNRQRAIGNEITFKTVNNSLYVWPEPKSSATIIIEYSKNAFGVESADGAISTSNSWGTNWIRKYSLAVAKGMLGKIRGKFSQVSGGPGTESQTLNAAELVAESKEELTALREELLEHRNHVQFIIQ